jgi:hypothetical protein
MFAEAPDLEARISQDRASDSGSPTGGREGRDRDGRSACRSLGNCQLHRRLLVE